MTQDAEDILQNRRLHFPVSDATYIPDVLGIGTAGPLVNSQDGPFFIHNQPGLPERQPQL